MQPMKQNKTSVLPNILPPTRRNKATRVVTGTLILSAIMIACVGTASAARPGDPGADIDYVGSGFVAQAGAVPPELANGVSQAGFLSNGPGLINGPGWVRQASCDSCGDSGCSSCDMGYEMSSCDGGCGISGGCGGGCGGGGGLLGKLTGRGCNGGCGPLGCGGLLGGGCGGGNCGGNVSTCEALRYHMGTFNPLGALGMLRPYSEAGLCAQRWYDVSAETLFLGRTVSGFGNNGVITTQGIAGTPVLTSDDLGGGDLEAGIRLSGAMIFGPGGNLELTYMGGQEWDDASTVTSPATFIPNPGFNGANPIGPGNFPNLVDTGADLYSFISDFGVNPAGGFDDTDRSISQTARSSADFHSGEFNYRRRTMGPYCRFQGSWLFGLRHLRYDEGLGLDIVGLNNDGVTASTSDGTLRFFNADSRVQNSLVGAQIGGDLWWNVMPGINFGIETKGAWLKNDIDSVTSISANSIAGGGPGTARFDSHQDDGTLAGEFQMKMIYRLSHSWSFRSAYYAIAIEEVALGDLDGALIQNVVQTNTSTPTLNMGSVVMQGFSFGTEYIW